MSNILSAIYDFITVAFIGGTICLFAAEIKLAAVKMANNGSSNLTKYTQTMTGTKLDLSKKRIKDYQALINKEVSYK